MPRSFSAPLADDRPYLELPFPGGSAYRVSCGYGCYQHYGTMSYAVDFDIPEGAPISAAAPGRIMAVTWEVGLPLNLNLGDALIVYIDHGGGWFTRYIHLSGITVEVGDEVLMGQIIGYSGKTGASGDHLHFELKRGSSLHSPSVPIDELFEGAKPVAGQAYRSNNAAMVAIEPLPFVPTPPSAPRSSESAVNAELAAAPAALEAPVESQAAAATSPAPAVAAGFEQRLPTLSEPLALSNAAPQGGERVQLTFTLHNSTRERLRLGALGVGARPQEGASRRDSIVAFDRAIVLNPGRSYTFEREVVLGRLGAQELFVFALGADNEWVPLAGDGQALGVTVQGGQSTLYVPLLWGPSAPAPRPAISVPLMDR